MYKDHGSTMQRLPGSYRRNVLNCPSLRTGAFITTDGIINKAQKPIALAAQFIHHVPDGEMVIEAFAGTGPVTRAALTTRQRLHGERRDLCSIDDFLYLISSFINCLFTQCCPSITTPTS